VVSHRRESLCGSGDMWGHIAGSLYAEVGTCGVTSPGVFVRKWGHVVSHRLESLCGSGDMWNHIAGSLYAEVGTCGVTSPGVFVRKWGHVGSHRRETTAHRGCFDSLAGYCDQLKQFDKK